MSCNIEYRYACLNLQQVKSSKDLEQTLLDFAAYILKAYPESEASTGCLEETFYEIQSGDLTEEQEIHRQIAKIAFVYLSEIDYSENGTTLLVVSEYDSERWDSVFADELGKYLFARSNETYFIVRSAAFDNWGGYSHQWIGYRKDGDIVLEHTDKYFQKVFQLEQDAALQAV